LNGERYYSFVKKETRFFVLDTNLLGRQPLAWIADALARAQESRGRSSTSIIRSTPMPAATDRTSSCASRSSRCSSITA
jgi:hypothetical protein